MSQVDSVAAARPQVPFATIRGILPGLAVCVGLTILAVQLRRIPGVSALSPAIIAIVLGIVARQAIGLPEILRPGMTFSLRTLLRTAVVLLGLQVTVGQILSLGIGALVSVTAGLVTCFFGTVWLGARLGVDPKLARLIGTGTGVCGASAVVAANSVTHGKDEDVTYALVTVTILGTIAMMVEPAVAILLHLDTVHAGLWLGASIHEVAQVVGGATQLGPEATGVATIAKMIRVLLLAPMVLTMAAIEHRRRLKMHQTAGETPPKVPVPWFAFGFLALVGVSSLGVVPHDVVKQVGVASSYMLATALAAMGFGVEVRAIKRKGLRPLILAVSSWLLIAGVSFGLVSVLG